MANPKPSQTRYHRASRAVSSTVGHQATLAGAVFGTVVWITLGLWLSFPLEWFLLTNLLGTVAVFLFLLVIQHSRQMHMRAIHTKLDELIRTSEAGNHLIGSERLADRMLDEVIARHREIASKAGD